MSEPARLDPIDAAKLGVHAGEVALGVVVATIFEGLVVQNRWLSPDTFEVVGFRGSLIVVFATFAAGLRKWVNHTAPKRET